MLVCTRPAEITERKRKRPLVTDLASEPDAFLEVLLSERVIVESRDELPKPMSGPRLERSRRPGVERECALQPRSALPKPAAIEPEGPYRPGQAQRSVRTSILVRTPFKCRSH